MIITEFAILSGAAQISKEFLKFDFRLAWYFTLDGISSIIK